MKKLFDYNIQIEGDNKIYIQGDYTPWYNKDNNCLSGQNCPLLYENLELISIDQNGLWLETIGKEKLLEDKYWYITEVDSVGCKFNHIGSYTLWEELADRLYITEEEEKNLKNFYGEKLPKGSKSENMICTREEFIRNKYETSSKNGIWADTKEEVEMYLSKLNKNFLEVENNERNFN